MPSLLTLPPAPALAIWMSESDPAVERGTGWGGVEAARRRGVPLRSRAPRAPRVWVTETPPALPPVEVATAWAEAGPPGPAEFSKSPANPPAPPVALAAAVT